jgi:uncharacterized membrane protein YjgN (DUF898 family)
MKALTFKGNGAEYFKIWIVNILLMIITLGLYYPWAKVRNNRYFYGNSELEGRSFEYHATGKRLFIGYLISMSVLILYIVIQSVSPVGSGLVLLAFLLGLPWIVWRSLQFNMRMTSFSNVRFGFDASLSQAYVNYLLIPIGLMLVLYGIPIAMGFLVGVSGGSMSLVVKVLMLVLGILFFPLVIFVFAFLKKRNTNYALNAIRYGQGEFSTDVQTKPFAIILVKAFGLAILLVILFLVLSALVAMLTGAGDLFSQMAGKMEDPEAMEQIFSGGSAWVIGAAYLGFIIISLFVFSFTHARQRQYIFENTKLDTDITFSSTLGAMPLAWVSVSNFFAIIFSLGFALPWAKVRAARLVLENSLVDVDAGFDQYVTQQQARQSALGEQLGDAFDVDLGIGI